jgi:Carboxypeptidase regulatory-like domain/TonB dependent receptor
VHQFKIRILCVSFFLLASIAFGQELGTAVLNGDVTDPSGAVISGAQVTAKNKATGVTRTTATNSAGRFVLNNLRPGAYEVRTEAGGFAPHVSLVNLEVGQQADLKLSLSVQEEQHKVDVQDTQASLGVNTVSSVVDGVINSQQIGTLPLNGRNFLELSLLLPGNTNAPNFDPTKSNTVVISSAGQLGRGGNVSIDGADNNDDAVGGMLINVPEDTVQEFQIATNRFSAELGRSGSSVVNVVTKSGSNDLHGSASFYERDKALQALPSTFDPTSTPGQTPPFRRQQYAANIGGPVVKNKAWWFAGFEYRDELGGVLVGTRDLATQTIPMSFAAEPLTDGMGVLRGDWQMTKNDLLGLHYNIERLDATGAASFLSGAPIGTASERQDMANRFQSFISSWTHIISPTVLSKTGFSVNDFQNNTDPLVPGPELDFPSISDGGSYRVPQGTHQRRYQFDEAIDWSHGKHNFHFGGQFQRVLDSFTLGVFQNGAVEFVQDFPNFDHNGDGVINDEDLLFAVSIRSAKPTQTLVIPNANNNHIAGYAQDDWHVLPQLTLNLGVRYELDTGVNDVDYYNNGLNPLLRPFLTGNRHMDTNNWGPRVGFNWANRAANFSVHGGYGIYYDRVTLEVLSLEQGLDGRALPINVYGGNVNYLDNTGHFVPGAPTVSNPFSGFIIPGAGGASEGMNVIDNNIQNPMVQQFNLGVQYQFAKNWIIRADGIHNLGTHFLIGVPVGSVFNPDSGGPETVTKLTSAANTHYDALWLTVDKNFSNRYQFHAAYTLSKTLNYANYDQVPFGYPPVDPNDLHREYGPAPNDQRNRFVLQATANLPWGFQFSPIWTWASGVPMDILYVDANGNKSRVPQIGRNAGGRSITTGAQLNDIISQVNANGGEGGVDLPLVSPNARFNDTFNSFDMRLSKTFKLSERFRLLAFGEAFNLFNKTNVLGVNNADYSGYFNVLVPDNNNPALSSKFGTPVSTAGGVFGSGGPRAFQLGAKFSF